MAGVNGVIKVRLVLANPKCLEALGVIAETLGEIAEDVPWREDAKEAVEAAKYLLSHLTCVAESPVIEVDTPPMDCGDCDCWKGN